MTEENKQPPLEEEAPKTEAAPEPQPEEPAEKAAKGKKKKEKGVTFTREQVEQMELAVKQLETVKDQFARLAAEYDNYRKRTAKEKETLYQDAKADTIKEFLAVYDNLERAAAAPGGEDDPHKKGLEMIFTQYKELLKKLGVSEIESKGFLKREWRRALEGKTTQDCTRDSCAGCGVCPTLKVDNLLAQER